MNPVFKDRHFAQANFILLIIWIGLCFFFYNGVIFLFPSHIHAWTQSDRLAIAYGFLENNFNFFKPQLYNLETIGGITRVDFPINEYIVAIIMKIIGSRSPAIFRLYTLAYSFTGLYFLFLLVYNYGKSVIKSFLIVVFVFTLPVFTYYQVGFLPTMTSLANIFIFYYFYTKYYEEGSFRYFKISILFLTLAALTRTPFVIFLFAAFCQFILEFLTKRKWDFQKMVLFMLAFGSVITYYLYNEYLGRKYGSAFLNALMPLNSVQEAVDFTHMVFDKWKYELATQYHYFIFGVALIYFIYQLLTKQLNYLKSNSDLIIFILISLIGTIVYFFLMQIQFEDHEYYFLDSLMVPLILFFIYIVSRISIKIEHQNIAWALLILFSVLSIKDSIKIQEYKYTDHNWNRQEITRKNFIDSEQLSDGLKIKKDAKILVLGSYSSNLPLILMNRKGYTCISFRENEIEKALKYPFDLLVIQNQFIFPDLVSIYPSIIDSFTPIGSNGKITFYKKSDHHEKGDYESFLGIKKTEQLKISLNDTISWNWDNLRKQNNTIIIEEGQEWGPTLKLNTNDPRLNKYSKALLQISLKRKDIENIKIILTREAGTQIKSYNEFIFPSIGINDNKPYNYHFMVNLPTNFDSRDDLYKIFIQNPEKKFMAIDKFDIILY